MTPGRVRAVRRGPDHDVNVMAGRQRHQGAECLVRGVEPHRPAGVPLVRPVPGEEHLAQQDKLGAVVSGLGHGAGGTSEI